MYVNAGSNRIIQVYIIPSQLVLFTCRMYAGLCVEQPW